MELVVHRSCDRPELAMWREHLVYGIRDAVGRVLCESDGRKVRRIQARALAWMESDNREVGSWVWTCEILGLDPVTLREQISGGLQVGRRKADIRSLRAIV